MMTLISRDVKAATFIEIVLVFMIFMTLIFSAFWMWCENVIRNFKSSINIYSLSISYFVHVVTLNIKICLSKILSSDAKRKVFSMSSETQERSLSLIYLACHFSEWGRGNICDEILWEINYSVEEFEASVNCNALLLVHCQITFILQFWI